MSSLSFIRFRVASWPCRALVLLALVSLAASCFGAQTAPPAPTADKGDETSTQDARRASLQPQEQLHATQLALERDRKETDAAAAENAKAFANRLQGIERALTLQRAQELDAVQSSNRAILFVAGLFAVLGLLAMPFMAYFQRRTINRLAEISAALPVARALGAGSPVAALGAGNASVVTVGPVEQSSQRLLGALEQLENRIHQLEHKPNPPLNAGASLAQAAPTPALSSRGEVPAATPAHAAAAPDALHIAMLLGKGHSLLNLDQPEDALVCFDQVLALDSNHAEALVKKGTALERLRKLDAAIACYDQAIAADGSMTVAYLLKGGLFNRMDRFGEALECYEQALRKQEHQPG
jgi:tetratricopeptide (TPR) repeat protein